jgi:hypothetical protein
MNSRAIMNIRLKLTDGKMTNHLKTENRVTEI